MFRFVLFAACGIALAATSSTPAGKFNKVLSVGDVAPQWSDLDGTDGKKHSFADLKGKDAVVVVFTCNTCPVAESYEDRIIAFAQKHAGPDAKVGLVAINVNTVPGDRLPAMKTRAEKKKFPFPYLTDPTQEIARKFGANYTPEFFVLDKDWKVAYLGSMDDKSPPADASVSHLQEAVQAVIAGKPAANAETLARGCRIRFESKKTDE